jgi:RimJ/RimL family protein N-acetyltransferase
MQRTIFIETERLVISPPLPSDFEYWRSEHAESDEKQRSHLTMHEWLDDHIRQFEKIGFGMGSVFLKETNEFVGRAGLFHCPDVINNIREIEMGYGILKKYRNKGYATELACGLITWGFKHLNINKIVALSRFDNLQSRRVLEKAGMEYATNVQSEGEDFLLYQIKKSRDF